MIQTTNDIVKAHGGELISIQQMVKRFFILHYKKTNTFDYWKQEHEPEGIDDFFQ